MLYPDKKPDFKDIFVAYCDINDLPITPARTSLLDLIVSQQYTSIVTFDKWGFLRYYFDQLLKEEISFEQFMTMGDIEGQIEDQINPHVYQDEHAPLLTTLTPEIVSSWDSKTLVVVSAVVQAHYVYQYGIIHTDAYIVVLD